MPLTHPTTDNLHASFTKEEMSCSATNGQAITEHHSADSSHPSTSIASLPSDVLSHRLLPFLQQRSSFEVSLNRWADAYVAWRLLHNCQRVQELLGYDITKVH